MITLKKSIDKEQRDTLTKQAEELEKLKSEMRNKQAQEEERRELQSLRSQIASLSQKLGESQKSKTPETINDR